MLAQILSVLTIVGLVFAAVIPQHNDDATKIVGGRNVTIEEYPWQASLLNATTGDLICGGTILDRYTILTAAHCAKPGDGIVVRVGSEFHHTGGDIRPVRRIVQHEFFGDIDLNNDIALVILQYPLFFNDRIQTAHLPEFDYDLPNNLTLLVSGWGTQNNVSDVLSEHLKAVAIQTVDQQECYEAYRSVHSTVTDNMFCAGSGGKDSCRGDSGGPVVEIYRERPIVHGIVSWGEDCGSPIHPGVYTRVSRYLQWISNNQ